MSGDSPYEERPDERPACPDCGGTRTLGLHREPCPRCGGPSVPDPAAKVARFRRTAVMLRRLRFGDKAKNEADALWMERRADELERGAGSGRDAELAGQHLRPSTPGSLQPSVLSSVDDRMQPSAHVDSAEVATRRLEPTPRCPYTTYWHAGAYQAYSLPCLRAAGHTGRCVA